MKKYSFLLFLFTSFVQVNDLKAQPTTASYSKMSQQELNAAFANAVYSNKVEEVENLLLAGADINTMIWEQEDSYPFSNHPLFFTAAENRPKMLRILLPYKNKVNNMDEEVASALGTAIYHEYHEIVQEFVKAGVNINYQRRIVKNTPLIDAATSSNEIVQILLKAGANVHLKDKDNLTALSKAVRRGHVENAQTLLRAGADLHERNNYRYEENKHGQTLLMAAVLNIDLPMVKMLIELPKMTRGKYYLFGDKPINDTDKDGNTALIHAAKSIRYSYRQGYQSEKDQCENSQEIFWMLYHHTGVDNSHANNAGETADALLKKLQKEASQH